MAGSAEIYREFSEEDKVAFKELKAEVEEKLGSKPSTQELLRAVTPGEVTPESLLNV